MPDKKWERLLGADRKIRRMCGSCMWDNGEVILTIEYFGGFEFFNTRPYHNYENWSEGYRIKTGVRGGNLEVTAEDLDDALHKMEKKLEEWRDEMGVDKCGNRRNKDGNLDMIAGKPYEKS